MHLIRLRYGATSLGDDHNFNTLVNARELERLIPVIEMLLGHRRG